MDCAIFPLGSDVKNPWPMIQFPAFDVTVMFRSRSRSILSVRIQIAQTGIPADRMYAVCRVKWRRRVSTAIKKE